MDFLRNLQPAAEAPGRAYEINAHIHLPPNFCDFTDVADAVRRAAAENVRLLGVANYYSTACFRPFAEACRRRKIFPLFGMECVVMREDFARAGRLVNDPKNPGKTYLCGKGMSLFDPPERARDILKQAARLDRGRAREMLSKLGKLFQERGAADGLEKAFDFEALVAETARRAEADEKDVVPQERHLARALQEALSRFDEAAQRRTLARVLGKEAAAAVPLSPPAAAQNALRNVFLKAGRPAYAEERCLAFEEMRELTALLGGVLVYPVVADGMSPVAEFEKTPDILADNLEAWGIFGVEFIPPRNTLDCLREYVRGLTGRGFFVTAGTEHNAPGAGSLIPAGRAANNSGKPVSLDTELRAAFADGAHVLAAHQYRRGKGEAGPAALETLPPAQRRKELRAWAALGARVVAAVL